MGACLRLVGTLGDRACDRRVEINACFSISARRMAKSRRGPPGILSFSQCFSCVAGKQQD
jgi:hypothetical protein